MSLTDAGSRPVKTYSGGMRRRPRPGSQPHRSPANPLFGRTHDRTRSPDQERPGQFIEELVAEGTTVLLTTQYMEEAEHLADRIVVLDCGRVVVQGTADNLKDQLGGDVLEIRVTNGDELERAAALVGPFGRVPPRVNPDLKEIRLPVKGSADVLIAAGRALQDGRHRAG